MAKNNFVRVFLGAAIGTAVAGGLVVGCGGGSRTVRSDKFTHVTLEDASGSCVLAKENKVWGKVSTDLTWDIDNHCEGTQTVTVGNFRTASGASGQNDCSAEGPQYPFASGSRTVDVGGGSDGKIKLKVKDDGKLPAGPLKYYFDICIGTTIADPELMIER